MIPLSSSFQFRIASLPFRIASLPFRISGLIRISLLFCVSLLFCMSLLFCISLHLDCINLLPLLLITASTDHCFNASTVHRFRFFKKSYVNLDTLSLNTLSLDTLSLNTLSLDTLSLDIISPEAPGHSQGALEALTRRSQGALKALSRHCLERQAAPLPQPVSLHANRLLVMRTV